MITIIHGDDISKSRNYLQEIKQKNPNNISFIFEKLSITDLVQNVEGSGLFNESKAIFIEEFLSKSKKSDSKFKEIKDFLIKNSKDSNFILWEGKEIQKKDLFLTKNSSINLFKLPKNIFLFLDNLKPNNSHAAIRLFHKAAESGIKEEIILFMMQRQFRILLAILEESNNQIEELVRLAPWQREKLEKQARLYKIEDLKKTFKKLYEIEISQKTGNLTLPLAQTIDFFLLEM